MIIDSVTVRNIRSYSDGETTIDFPEGTVLIEGDVGSGKSTVLYAIEFALFGVAEMTGSYLLTEGKNKGFAELTFVADGASYTVHRGLKRGKKAIAQEDCYITANGHKELLSPTDLKSRVVDILKFNEPRNPKAQSLIYRFAIFTPQEKMKEIVAEDSASRLPTLRKVLGLEDYKVALDNSDFVARRIRTNIERLRGASSGLEEKEAQALGLKEQIGGLEKSMPELEQRESAASRNLDELNAKQRELAKDRERLVAISNLVPDLERNVQTLEVQIIGELELFRRNEEKLAKDAPLIEEFQRRKPPSDKSWSELETEKASKQSEKEKLVSAQAKLEQRLKETDDLIQKGECPLCGQKIVPAKFGEKSSHLHGELESVGKERETVEKEVSALSLLQEAVREYEMERERIERLVNEKAELEPLVSEARVRVGKETAELELQRRRLAELKEESSKMSELLGKTEKLDKELQLAQNARDEARDELTKARTQKEEKVKELGRVEKEVQGMKLMRVEAGRLGNYTMWLATYFQPTVEAIEKQMMVQMNMRFDQEFKRFYSTLIEDQELTVRVDDQFKPIFERHSYEQDYDALSGGERTSVALAYRLALNAIVQEVATSSAGELLILDEPTEGFSKAQLYKVRDTLEELECRQVILVSHESELEGMADHIFKVEKVNGVSRILSTSG